MSGQFGDYHLLEVIGSGDMGTTHRAQHFDQTEPVALKILDKIDSSSDMQRGAAVEILEFAASFKHERLHPILEVLDSPHGEGRLALVMPLSPIGSVQSVAAKGNKINPKHGFKLVAQVASGLQYLHSQEVAHGDIKPSNILLDDEGDATITDLSMAHLREFGYVPGQPSEQHMYYAPPEREYHGSVQTEHDVYSLAVLTYYLLTGEIPFDDPMPEARTIIPPRNLPPAVAAVLRRALGPQLRLRYATLDDFMSTLKAATRGEVDTETEKLFGVTGTLPSLDED
jgi:serine/threonine-protein kinase